MKLCIGLDYGTNSARAIVVNSLDGAELGSSVFNYKMGNQGVMGDPRDANTARQSPSDYVEALESTIRGAISDAREKNPSLKIEKNDFIGIGVDTTGSTVIPVLKDNTPISFLPHFENNLDAQAWLWKDHTSFAESDKITSLALSERPEYLKNLGGKSSSEWFWSKVFHCLNSSPEVFEAAYSWVEISDWIPSLLCGVKEVSKVCRNRCAAGHKWLYSEKWGGLPDVEFLSKLSPELASLRGRLFEKTRTIGEGGAGVLCAEWADKLGLPEGISIAVGELDVHYGAVGCGIGEGVLVKAMGTSGCDCIVVPKSRGMPEISGICGAVDGSILPNFYGVEAGQSALGDIYKWWVEGILGGDGSLFKVLRGECENLRVGESGIIALDWNNGNRSVLSDQRLTGLIMGQTLHTTRGEIYRSLIEASAYGARVIAERFAEGGARIEKIVCCGGIADKDEMTMQIFSDVLNREIFVSKAKQTCALGAAIGAAVAAGAYASIGDAQAAMTGLKSRSFKPVAENVEVYDKLFSIYKKLHDSFGGVRQCDMAPLMKELLEIKETARNA